MPRRLLAASGAVLLTILLAACTSAPGASPDSSTPSSSPTSAPGGTSAGNLPSCGTVTDALPELLAGLSYDEALSASQTAQEAYEQRVCVYANPDATAQVGVTIAAIPFLDTELKAYGALPTSIADDRLAEHGAVLQTLKIADGDDGHLDSSLFLFDLDYSITIQGYAKDGSSTATTLPQLSVAAATDAAFAVRALIS